MLMYRTIFAIQLPVLFEDLGIGSWPLARLQKMSSSEVIRLYFVQKRVGRVRARLGSSAFTPTDEWEAEAVAQRTICSWLKPRRTLLAIWLPTVRVPNDQDGPTPEQEEAEIANLARLLDVSLDFVDICDRGELELEICLPRRPSLPAVLWLKDFLAAVPTAALTTFKLTTFSVPPEQGLCGTLEDAVCSFLRSFPVHAQFARLPCKQFCTWTFFLRQDRPSRLTVLNGSGTDGNAPSSSFWASAPALEQLDCCPSISPGSLGTTILPLPFLEVLNLRPTGETGWKILQELSALALRELVITLPTNELAVPSLANIIREQFPRLRRLTLVYNCLTGWCSHEVLEEACRAIGCQLSLQVDASRQGLTHQTLSRMKELSPLLSSLDLDLTAIDFTSQDVDDHHTESLVERVTFPQLRSLTIRYDLGDVDAPDHLAEVEPLAVTGFWQYIGSLLRFNAFPVLESLVINACTISLTILLDMVFAVRKLPTLTRLQMLLNRVEDCHEASPMSALETDAGRSVGHAATPV